MKSLSAVGFNSLVEKNHFQFNKVGEQLITNVTIENEETKNEILAFFRDNTELSENFCQGLKSSLIEFAEGFTNNEDQKRIRINKIKNSLEILEELGHGLDQREKANFSFAIGKNFYKIKNLLDDTFDCYLDENSLVKGVDESRQKEWVFKVEIKPMMELYSEGGKECEDEFIKMIAKSFIKDPKFDKDLFDETIKTFDDAHKKIFIGKMKEELLGKANQSPVEVADVFKCLEVYKSLKEFKHPSDDYSEFEENFFSKIGRGVEKLLHKNTLKEESERLLGRIPILQKLLDLKTQIESFDTDSKRHFCVGLSRLFLENASSISYRELAILEELNPNFYSENPNFKKQFYRKMGEEFNPYCREGVNWLKDNFVQSIEQNHELAGYFYEGLSNILVTKFERKQDKLSDLKNRFNLYNLLSKNLDPDDHLLMKQDFQRIYNLFQNKISFKEDSKSEIENNLRQFNEKFATDFVSFLTSLKNPSPIEKKEIDEFVDNIIESGNIDIHKIILDLLEKNIQENDETGIPKGINVRNKLMNIRAKELINKIKESDDDLGDDIIKEENEYVLKKVLDLFKKDRPLNRHEDIVETKIKDYLEKREGVVNPAQEIEVYNEERVDSGVDSRVGSSLCSDPFSCLRGTNSKSQTNLQPTTLLPAQNVMECAAVIVSSSADVCLIRELNN